MFSEEQYLFTPVAANDEALGVVFAFPNEYSVGITSLGYQIVWALLCQRPDVQVGRLFTDGQESLPSPADLVGFSLSWELDYVNILNLLEAQNIPLLARDRTDDHPIVFGGGPVLTANPEPFADFFDVILLGDGEQLLHDFLDSMHELKGSQREQKLRSLSQIPGIYVPDLYDITYLDPTGPIQSITPKHPEVPATVQKQTYRGTVLSASTVVTPKAAWENIFMVEVVRSCPEMCRFCLASYLTLPFRPASLENSLIPAIQQGMSVTRRLGLLGASITQHPEFDAVLDYVNRPEYDDVRMSLSSVRTNTVTPKLAKTLVSHGAKSITIAIESGSQRIRDIVNKKLDTAEIFEAAKQAKAGGLTSLKLYGMAGVPGETETDLDQTAELMLSLKKQVPGLRLTLGCSTFVPKGHTPFQWLGVNKQAEKRLKFLQKKLRSRGIDFRPESYSWSVIQALISRGDRRLAPLLLLTREYGDTLGSFRRAFKDLKGSLPPLSFYVHEDWSLEQTLPWEHLAGPLPKQTLIKHLADAQTHL